MESAVSPIATCTVKLDRAHIEEAFDESVEHRLTLRKHLPKFVIGLGGFTVALMVARPGIWTALYFWGSAWLIYRELTYRRRMLAAAEAAPGFGKESSIQFFDRHLETTMSGEPIEIPYADFDRMDETPKGLFLVSGNGSIFVPRRALEPTDAFEGVQDAIRAARGA